MTYVLILTLHIAGQAPETRPVGLMTSQSACNVAGAGMAHVITATTPEATVSWACVPYGAGA